jgi:predicted  nucleic acid-binding Zn-ribbon protein
MSEDNVDRLLGQLMAKVNAMENSISELKQQNKESQRRFGDLENALRTELQELRDFTLELKGGKKALVALLAVAGVVGGFIWDIVQRYLFSN